MLIGLLSDTHIASPNQKLPPQIKEAFRGVDLILHAGDIWIPSVLDELETIAPVVAAWGDDDVTLDFNDDRRMLKGHALSFDGVNLWLMHVRPHYALMYPKNGSSLSRFIVEDDEETPDVVVFGHTHHETIERYKDVLLVNPGSATFPNYVPKPGTVGLLTIRSGAAEARIVPLV